jgi:hypothetical protein
MTHNFQELSRYSMHVDVLCTKVSFVIEVERGLMNLGPPPQIELIVQSHSLHFEPY